jgi:hypothetical protein
MSMMLEELRERIAEFNEEKRQERISLGLPPDRPKRKRNLPDHIAPILFDRLQGFVDACVEIARLYRAGHFLYIDLKRFAKYRRDARLLCRSRVFDAWITGTKVFLIFGCINLINKQIEAGFADELDEYSPVQRFYESVIKLKQELPRVKEDYEYFLGRNTDE